MPLSSRILLWLCLLATAATAFARSVPTINAGKAHEAAFEQVMWEGRVCPLSTLANDFLSFVYGKSTYKGLSAVQVVYGWRLRPDVWKDEPMIHVADADLRRQLDIEGEYASFAQLFDDTLGYRLKSLGNDLPAHMRPLLRESPAFVELDEKVGIIIELTEGRLIQPRPDSIPPLSPLRLKATVFYDTTPAWVWWIIFPILFGILLISLYFCRHKLQKNKLHCCFSKIVCLFFAKIRFFS